jgi:hypothetical protein
MLIVTSGAIAESHAHDALDLLIDGEQGVWHLPRGAGQE